MLSLFFFLFSCSSPWAVGGFLVVGGVEAEIWGARQREAGSGQRRVGKKKTKKAFGNHLTPIK